MVEFQVNYANAMDKEKYMAPDPWEGPTQYDDIERPIVPIREIGKTVTEGRTAGGTFLESFQAAIREGAGTVELATQMEGQEPRTGAEGYGKEARDELRTLAAVNKVKITSVHAPVQVGNISGFAGPERGFVNEQREMQVNEIKKAIEFASDVTEGGSAIVFHTGEFHRPMAGQDWNKDPVTKDEIFKTFAEEQERAVVPLVDRRTGHVIQQVRKNQPIARPIWLRSKEDYEYVDPQTNKRTMVHQGDYIDYFKRPLSYEQRVPEFDKKTGRFKVELVTWDKFEELAQELTVKKAREIKEKYSRELLPDEIVKPEEAFLQTQVEVNERQARGWALFHSSSFEDLQRQYKQLLEAREWYKKFEANVPEQEKWKLMQDVNRGNPYINPEKKMPSEIIDKMIRESEWRMEHIREGSVGYEMQAQEQQMLRNNAVSVRKYALFQSAKSLAESGIFAMDVTKQKHLEKPIFIAPENVWPEMGYGSHPEEIIELIKMGRDKMVEYLTADRIQDPSMVTDKKSGEINWVDNPYKRSGVTKEQAAKLAEEHIKMTLDTQHLGMWWRYFQKKPGESEQESRERFNKWYMEQMQKLVDTKTVGYVHLVDGWGRGHTHLPIGEGNAPAVTAIEYLKKKGFTGSINSEGFAEPGRQLTRTWAAFGSPIYSAQMGPMSSGMPQRWSDVWHSYFHRPPRSPYYVFGAYSPSEDWTLWTGVQME